MKKILILCLLVSIYSVSNAQTITQWFSTYQSGPCAPVWFNDSVVMCGFNNGDLITGTIDFGDGTVIALPDIIYNNANMFCSPGCDCMGNYNLTHAYTSPGVYTVTKTRTGPGAVPNIVSGPVTVTGSCSQYTGYVYNDINANCVMDAGEELPGASLVLKDVNNVNVDYAGSDAQGYYTLSSTYNPGDVFTVHCNMAAANCALVACPVTLTYLVNTQTAANLNFGMQYTNPAFDLYIYGMSSSNPFMPGLTKKLYLLYGNGGCAPANGTLTYNFPTGMTFVNAVPAPTSVAGNTATWSLNNIVGLYKNIEVTAILPTHDANNQPYLLGDTMCGHLSIVPAIAGDVNLTNNNFSPCLAFGYSYDPNNKEVSPKGEGANGNVSPGTQFTYNINFQNTGNAPALNVVIRDTLDDDLDPATLVLLKKSHHMILTQNGKYLEFSFPHIMLPDSTTDFAKSMGFVQYKINHKNGLALGTKIENTASIYFDLNTPVVTNTTLNTLYAPTGTSHIEKESLMTIHPNPAGDYFLLAGIQNKTDFIITDVRGVVCASGSILPHQRTDVSGLPKGIYLLKANNQIIKIVKL